jgi:hypothetical protein
MAFLISDFSLNNFDFLDDAMDTSPIFMDADFDNLILRLENPNTGPQFRELFPLEVVTAFFDYIDTNYSDTERIESDKNYIYESAQCRDYCGAAGDIKTSADDNCQRNKKDLCTNKNQWMWDPELDLFVQRGVEDYCFDYFQRRGQTVGIDSNEVEIPCGELLISSDPDRNILSGKSCGYLCRDIDGGSGTNIDDEYCNTKRQQFCFKKETDGSYPNLFSTYCFNFCQTYPDFCVGSGNVEGLDDICTREFPRPTSPEEANDIDWEALYGKLEQVVNQENGLQWEDFCGCLLGKETYDKYTELLFDAFENLGYTVNAGTLQLNTNPECIFNKCKTAIKERNAQNNTQCVECIQTINFNVNNSNINCNFVLNQQQACGNETDAQIIQEDPNSDNFGVCNDDPPPVTTEPPPGGGGGGSDGGGSPLAGGGENENTIIIIVIVMMMLGFVVLGLMIYGQSKSKTITREVIQAPRPNFNVNVENLNAMNALTW